MTHNKKIVFTQKQIQLYHSIEELQKFIVSATLTETEMAQQIDMTKKQKEKLV